MEESKDLVFKFNPTKELLDFADSFSKKYDELSVGHYCSDSQNYRIDYVDKIEDNKFGEYNTNLRVNINTGVIQISKSKLMKYHTNEDYLFFQILWCVIQREVRNDMLSDKIALEYCLENGRSFEKIIKGMVDLFKNANTPHNLTRLEKIEAYVKNIWKYRFKNYFKRLWQYIKK